MDGKMVIFSAPSGSGKSTIIQQVLLRRKDLEFSISATTRQPRGAERDGIEYYFLTIDDFRSRISRGELVEYEQVYEGRYYGTLKSEMDRIWGKGHSVLFDIDVVGAVNLKAMYGAQALSIFVQPPSVDVLRQRLVGRSTDSPEEIEKRVAKAEFELSYAGKFDVVIVNDVLDKAIEEVVLSISNFLK